MDNPIKYEDLFSTSLLTEIGKLKTGVGELKKELESMVVDVKKATTAINKGDTKKIDDVYKAYKKMKIELDAVNGQLEKLNGSSQNVALTQKEINKVVKLGTEYNSERADSYNALSKQYSAMKILINNMTKAERENTEEGKAMVDNARRIYEEMNRLQQSTGKFQLQVGNYSKALGGLNIATQQVIREMPVLANGIQMFVMAIGNNIPILIDQIQAFRKEQDELAKAGKRTTSVLSAMAKTIFSWQTAIVVVLSVLPMLIKKLQENKKRMEELNGESEEAKRNMLSYAKSMDEVGKSELKATNEIRLLVGVINDENRSLQDRIDAGKVLKQTFDEELEGYSAQEIAMGKAKTAIDKITQSIIEQARATGLVNEISRLASEQYEQMREVQRMEEEDKSAPLQFGGKKGISAVYRYYRGQSDYGKGIVEKTLGRKDFKRLQEFGKYWERYHQLAKDIEKLSSKFKPSGLIDTGGLGGGGKDTKERVDYLMDVIETGIELMADGEEKEVLQAKFGYERKIKLAHDELDEMHKVWDERKAKGKKITEEEVYQEQLLNAKILGLVEAREKAIYDIREEYDRKEEEARQKELDGITKDVDKYYKETEKWVNEQLKGMQFGISPEENVFAKGNLIMSLLGFEDDDKGGYSKYMKSIEKAFNLAFDYMQKWLDMRREMAHLAVESAQEEEDSAKHAMDIEMEARANGYAHNVEYARREYEEKKKIKEEALAEEQRIAQIQQKIDEAQQMSSLLVATANIWATYTKGNVLGTVLAGIATTAMWGAFASAKIQASQLTKTKKYGEGGSEYLDYGGSHASGNDIDFGVMKDGTRRRVERGEMVAVINKRSVAKYGVNGTRGVIDSLNDGTFNDNYGLAFAGLTATPNGADLSRVEKGIDTLVAQGEKKVVQNGDTTIEYYRNRKRIIKN